MGSLRFYNKKFNYKPTKLILSLRKSSTKCLLLDNYKIHNDESEQFAQKVNLVIQNVTKERDNIHYIKMRDISCDHNGCKLMDKNNYPIFSDTIHLSIWGRDIVTPIILKRIGISI